jgi:dephospho-CoA kinase
MKQINIIDEIYEVNMRLSNFLINEGINDQGIMKAVFMAGHPGAGKSFVLNKIKSGNVEPRWVNTDKAFVEDKRLKKLEKQNPETIFKIFQEHWNEGWPLIKDDVKRINKNQLALYINSMLPLAVDGTSNSISLLHTRKGLLERFGYDTAMVFINTDLETAIARAKIRSRKVNPDFIEQTFQQVTKHKAYYRSLFNEWQEIPNSEGELTPKVIQQAFKQMGRFFDSPIKNPVGQDTIKRMKEEGLKYLTPEIRDMSEIKKVVSVWYRS